MKNIRKITALVCALSIMAMAAGCSSKNENSENESAAETVTTEATTKAAEEEMTEEESEESAEEEETTEESEESESDSDENSDAADADLDMEGTLGTLNYKYSSDWQEAVVGDQITYTLSDLSGAIVIQKHSADELGSLSEETTIQVLAEQSETAWQSLDNMELLSGEWAEDVVDGKKCYSVTYSYTVASIDTTNTTFFFANFTDDSKELFAVTASTFTEGSDIDDIVREMLSNVSFS